MGEEGAGTVGTGLASKARACVLHLDDCRRKMDKVKDSWPNVQCTWVVPPDGTSWLRELQAAPTEDHGPDGTNLSWLMNDRSEYPPAVPGGPASEARELSA